MEEKMGERGVSGCLGCRHFRVTWEAERPYACLRFGFKSRDVPALEVERASGAPCAFYSPRRRGSGGRSGP